MENTWESIWQGSHYGRLNFWGWKEILNVKSWVFLLCSKWCCHGSRNAVSFFSVVQKIHVFVSASTWHWPVLNKHVNKLKVKPLSDTRWENRIESIRSFRYWCNIYNAMYEISQDLSYDPLTWHQVESQAYHMKYFKLLLCAVSSHYILNHVNMACKTLQQKILIILAAKDVLSQYYIWRPTAQKIVCKCSSRCQTDGCIPWH
jgi:hypothetical protein